MRGPAAVFNILPSAPPALDPVAGFVPEGGAARSRFRGLHLSIPLPVAFWTPASCRVPLEAALAPLSAQMALRFHAEEEAATGLPAVLAADPVRPCVAVWSGLEAHLATHLAGISALSGDAEGEAQVVAEALADWLGRAEALLAAFARARRRVTLLPAAAVLAAPTGAAAALAARLGLADAGLGADPAPAAAVLPPDLPAHALLMAAAVLQTAPAARSLLDRLEAASLPVAGFTLARARGAAGLAAVLATQGQREAARLEALQADLARAETARALTAEALAAQTDMAVRLAQAEASARAEARAAAADLAQTAEALAREAAAVGEATETARRLQERLVQGAAERAWLEAELRTELQTEVARRVEVEGQRDALLASTSWRITAPLRWLVLALRRLRGRG
jgi:hypothetical protein